MNSTLLVVYGTTAFLTGLAVFVFAFRKDVHSVRLEVTHADHGAVILGINNDSAVAFGVLSIGFISLNGQVKWIDRIGNYVTNLNVRPPIRIGERSLFTALFVAERDVPSSRIPHGYCVQLETGRFYVLRNTLPFRRSLPLFVGSLISRLTRGRWAPKIKGPRLPLRD